MTPGTTGVMPNVPQEQCTVLVKFHSNQLGTHYMILAYFYPTFSPVLGRFVEPTKDGGGWNESDIRSWMVVDSTMLP